MLDLSVIILTYNEEIHIRRCLENVCKIAQNIYVIDSYSTDKTIEIAKEFPNVTILQHEWPNNHGIQFNWGLEHANISSKWILRLDADEYLSDELKIRLENELESLSEDIAAIEMRRKLVFMGRTIKGGSGKNYFTRIFRYGKGKSETKRMDEHIVVSGGQTVRWDEIFFDDNLNDLAWWTNKHNGYSIREAADLLDAEYHLSDSISDGFLGNDAASARQKKSIYSKMPLFFRSFAYFIYRYFVRGGFLEGKEGFIWCFLQGWWYRTLVDAKIYEIKKNCGSDRELIKQYLTNQYNIDFNY